MVVTIIWNMHESLKEYLKANFYDNNKNLQNGNAQRNFYSPNKKLIYYYVHINKKQKQFVTSFNLL